MSEDIFGELYKTSDDLTVILQMLGYLRYLQNFFQKTVKLQNAEKNWSPSTSIPNQKWLTLESTNQPTSYPRSPKIITPQIDTVGGKTSCTSWYRKYPIYMVSYCEVVDILVIRSRMVSHNCLVTIGFGEPRNMKKLYTNTAAKVNNC